VTVDDSPSGRLASRLAGLLAGSQRLPTTILRLAPETARSRRPARRAEALAKTTAATARRDDQQPEGAAPVIDITTRPRDADEDTVTEEAKKGYDLLVVGAEPMAEQGVFADRVARVAGQFDGPVAITAAQGAHRREGRGRSLDILVPVTGTAFS